MDSAFSKIFCTKTHELIDNSRTLFNYQPVVDTLSQRKKSFSYEYIKSNNDICRLFANNAVDESAKLLWQ